MKRAGFAPGGCSANHLSRAGTTHSGLGLPHPSITDEEDALQLSLQSSLIEAFSQLRISFLSSDFSLCQGNIN